MRQQIIAGGAAVVAVAALAAALAAIVPSPPPTHKHESLIYVKTYPMKYLWHLGWLRHQNRTANVGSYLVPRRPKYSARSDE
jgi:hypothetical protein